ncbi:hypothetical protein PENSPDRAFT_551691, partial [Peniophora sp. CONT]
FPEMCPRSLQDDIVAGFQDYIDAGRWKYYACAVCGQKKFKSELSVVPFTSAIARLLVNDDIPDRLAPVSYDFDLYERAFLCAAGMKSPFETQGPIDVCDRCHKSLERQRMPLDAIANYQYYAHERLPSDVREAFASSTFHERQLIAGCRATKVTFVYKVKPTDKKGKQAPRRFTKGNVAILPQQAGRVSSLIPPAPDEIDYSICVVFIGGEYPTWETIAEFNPVMVSRSRVAVMAEFLAKENVMYKEDGIRFSKTNLDALCSKPGAFRGDLGITSAVQILHVKPNGRNDTPSTGASSSRKPDEDDLEGVEAKDLLVNVIGFAEEHESWVGKDAASKLATEWCRSRKPFITVGRGAQLLPERDVRALTFLCPHLDPYALGAFGNPLRKNGYKLSIKRQLRNMLRMFNGPFEHDYNFAFIMWNIVQKLENTRAAMFSVKEEIYRGIVDELVDSVQDVDKLCLKFAENHDAKPVGPKEIRIVQLLNKMKAISRDMPGSNSRKLRQRNEVRALLKIHGCPALFITLTPSDVFHVLPYVLSGGDSDHFLTAAADEFALARVVARNPAAAAVFFDIMIKGFFDEILRYGDGGSRLGLFGTCEAYYATVEAQGRGTLHAHMVIWLRGNPSPQELRDRVRSEPGFALRMVEWLETRIKCELPGMTEAIERPADEVERPPKESGTLDPRSMPDPILRSFELDDDGMPLFDANFADIVTQLAIRCNWHKHTDTCFKHLKGSEPRDDAHCRMRIDGQVRASTTVDEDTGIISLRRLHPWINNYDEVVMFLMKCNMDIKHISSGEAAKALVYYITDYITKGQLPMYVALDALRAAIHKTMGNVDRGTDPVKFRRSLLTRIMNGIMGKMELSHQQVMAFLVGGGDHYTSHTFRTLNWGVVTRYIRERETVCTQDQRENVGAEYDVEDDDDDNVPREGPTGTDLLMNVSGKTMTATNTLLDYLYRSLDPAFEKLCLWDLVAGVEYLTKEIETARLEKRTVRLNKDGSESKSRGRPAANRVPFSSAAHPKFETHVARLRTIPVVPVILGPTLPRRDRAEEEWCRAMLILFKPWRSLEDLKRPSETW